MKLALGVLLFLCGGTGSLYFGFVALMLGGGSLAQSAEAPTYAAGALGACLVALGGMRLMWQHVTAKRRATLPPP